MLTSSSTFPDRAVNGKVIGRDEVRLKGAIERVECGWRRNEAEEDRGKREGRRGRKEREQSVKRAGSLRGDRNPSGIAWRTHRMQLAKDLLAAYMRSWKARNPREEKDDDDDLVLPLLPLLPSPRRMKETRITHQDLLLLLRPL